MKNRILLHAIALWTLFLVSEGFHMMTGRKRSILSLRLSPEDELWFAETTTEQIETPPGPSSDQQSAAHHHEAPRQEHHPPPSDQAYDKDEPFEERYESVSRRKFLKLGTVLLSGALVGTATLQHSFDQDLRNEPGQLKEKTLAPVNLTLAAKETTINVTLDYPRTFVSLDKTTFQKRRNIKLPDWVPRSLVPVQVIRDVSDSELLLAAVVAGSMVEMFRTTTLYPLLTLKSRIQADVNTRQRSRRAVLGDRLDVLQHREEEIDEERERIRKLVFMREAMLQRREEELDRQKAAIERERESIRVELRQRGRGRQYYQKLVKRRLKIVWLNIQRHYREGQLYAGIAPSLLISVPATGVYYGIRDVVKRTLVNFPNQQHSALNNVQVAVAAALIADVVSLAIRTPADALAIRRQIAASTDAHHGHHEGKSAATSGNATTSAVSNEEAVDGNWFVESIERLPAVILTDLPFLLSRIAINRAVIQGDVNIGQYEAVAIITALTCAFLTTPFDVARTRILLDSDDDVTTGIDGGSGEGLIRTFKTIMNEGDGGIRNLFAGWLERTTYLGIARAFLEPLQLLGYMWIRDSILLQWFD